LLCRKSPLFVPTIVMLVIVNADPPVLVRVIFCAALIVCRGWLLKARLDGEKLTAGVLEPVPVRLTICGLPAALSTMEMLPV
jgi:hypothetical protein